MESQCSPSSASQAKSMGLLVPWTSFCPTPPHLLKLVPWDKESQSSDLGLPRLAVIRELMESGRAGPPGLPQG